LRPERLANKETGYLMRQEHKERMVAASLAARLAAKGKPKTPLEAQIRAIVGDRSEAEIAKILRRAEEIPLKCIGGYLRSVSPRHGPKQAIRAFCAMCFGWDSGFRESIQGCTDPACPLFTLRPYQSAKPRARRGKPIPASVEGLFGG
jgi:hypothetical protein